ncbi:MAG: serine hydrolase [Bacteroidales bacterium]|nr:serine hydrolase [Bacteroidales bacterium]
MKNLIFLFWLLLSINIFGQIKENQAIDSIFSEWNKPSVPGCALGIIRDGKLIYAKGYGLANLEKNIPISTNSVFEIASTSKQFTATCIVLLAEQGKLNLDNKLSDFFPEFPDYANQITIRHLLHHTSGIRNDGTLAFSKKPC